MKPAEALPHEACEALIRDQPDVLARHVPLGIINAFVCFPPEHPETYGTLLHKAIRLGSPRCVRWLLEQGADPRIARSVFRPEQSTWELACMYPDARCLSLLVDVGRIDANTPIEGTSFRAGTRQFSGLRVAWANRADWSALEALLLRGARLNPTERALAAMQGSGPDKLMPILHVAWQRSLRCARVCRILMTRRVLRGRISMDVRRALVRGYVWRTRFREEWAPELVMPACGV